jgi:hypothetical protein
MKKEISSMIIIPPKKIKSKGDTIQMFLADQDKFKTFYRDVCAYLKSTQDTCRKEGYGDDPWIIDHSGYHEWSDSVPFRRFNHFCYQRGLDWRGSREALEIMPRDQYRCECEILRRYTDEEVEEILSGKRKR